MQSLINEQFTPKDQAKSGDPVKYKIKPLSSLQLSEVMQDGAKAIGEGVGLNYLGVLLCLKYGLDDPTKIKDMFSSHHAEVSMAIFNKSLLTEQERKN